MHARTARAVIWVLTLSLLFPVIVNAKMTETDNGETILTFIPLIVEGPLEPTVYGQALSDVAGVVRLPQSDGSTLTIVVKSTDNQIVTNVTAMSAADGDGMVVLWVPPGSSEMVSKISYFQTTETSSAASNLLTSDQSTVTTTLVRYTDEPAFRTQEVPRGLLDDLWRFHGWQPLVENTYDFCGSLSTTSMVAHSSYEGTTAIVWYSSLKKSGQHALGGIHGVVADDALVELCLAASGDEAGLTDLTAMIHPGTGMAIAIKEDSTPPIVGCGKVLGADSKEPLINAMVSSNQKSMVVGSEGFFCIGAAANTLDELSVQSAGYVPAMHRFASPRPDILVLEDFLLSPLGPRDVHFLAKIGEQDPLLSSADLDRVPTGVQCILNDCFIDIKRVTRWITPRPSFCPPSSTFRDPYVIVYDKSDTSVATQLKDGDTIEVLGECWLDLGVHPAISIGPTNTIHFVKKR